MLLFYCSDLQTTQCPRVPVAFHKPFFSRFSFQDAIYLTTRSLDFHPFFSQPASQLRRLFRLRAHKLLEQSFSTPFIKNRTELLTQPLNPAHPISTLFRLVFDIPFSESFAPDRPVTAALGKQAARSSR